MRLRAKHAGGILDISSLEQYETEGFPFRRSLRPGQIIEIPDQYRALRNIDGAIKAGLLEILSYDSSPGQYSCQCGTI